MVAGGRTTETAAAEAPQAGEGPPMSHEARRPGWDCDTCPGSKPWPSDPARERLAEEYAGQRALLSIHMGIQLADATREAPGEPREMWERFVAWTR